MVSFSHRSGTGRAAGTAARASAAAACFVALSLVGVGAQQTAVRYTAFAVNQGDPTAPPASVVEMQVSRWSTDAERDQLINTIVDLGQKKLVDLIDHMPQTGVVRAPDNSGYDLRYARRTVNPDGTERIFLVTDRPVGFWETRGEARTLDYPFTVIELQIGPNGKGTGTLSVATKITASRDSREIRVETLGEQPIALQSVQRTTK